MEKNDAGMPKHWLLTFLTCFAGALLFVIVGLQPLHGRVSRLNGEILELRGRVSEQEVLYPVYTDLLESSIKDEAPGIVARTRRPLAQQEIGTLSALVSGLAQSSKLQLASLTPETDSLAGGAKRMPVRAALRGGFSDMRGFLLELENLPFVEHMEELQIQDFAGPKELRLKMWVAVSDR
jgi:hypothetical protein